MAAVAPSPAEGLVVLELSTGISGALAGRILADHGAAVTRIHRPDGDTGATDPATVTWHVGKDHRALDLTTPVGRDELLGLVTEADVLIDSLRPGRMDSWGLGYDVLAERNPALVACSITGFGPTGPMASVPGFELLVQAYAGIAGDQAGFRDGPVPVAVPLAGVEAGLLAAAGIYAALLARERGLARGQRVDTSVLAGSLVMQLAVLAGTASQPPLDPPQHPLGASPTFRLYQCGDGRWIQLTCVHPAFFRKLLAATELTEALTASSLASVPSVLAAPEERERVADALVARFRERPRDEWVATLLAADVPCAPVQDPEELWDDPLFRGSGILVESAHPELGRMRHVGRLFEEASGGPARSALPPLAAGQAPLEHVRVLELGGYQAAPTAGRLLADLGAEVIKVEPLTGDPFRGMAPIFVALNHGKRSIAVDLAAPDGQQVVQQLSATCDVLVHNLRPGVAERHGIDDGSLAAANPGLVWVGISGFGAHGPAASRPAYDALGQALVGIQRAQGGPADNPPSLVRTPVCDASAGTAAAVAVLAGLLGRQRHGHGSRAETSLVRMGAAFMADHLVAYAGRPAPRQFDEGQHGTGPLTRLYRTADGWVALVGRPDTWPLLRAELPLGNRPSADELASALAARTTHECLALLEREGVDATPVTIGFARQYASDPQLRAASLLAEVDHPDVGRATFIGPPIQFSATPARLGPPASRLGEDGDDLLAELGLAPSERRALRERGVVAGPSEEG